MIETSRTVDIFVNGDEHIVQSNTSLVGLLEHLKRDPNMPGIAVAINDTVIRRNDWRTTHVQGGDRVEIITASQGG